MSTTELVTVLLASFSFTVNGQYLSSSMLVSAPADYEVSLTSGTGFATSVSLIPTSGTVSTTIVYVRFKAGLSAGTYNNEFMNITANHHGKPQWLMAVF
jgi:hypothetical protein